MGTATITATMHGVNGSAAITVTPALAASVVIDQPSPQAIPVNGKVRLTASARDASGAVMPGKKVTWSCLDAFACSVTADGIVTGLVTGRVGVTASVDGKEASITVVISGLVFDLRVLGTPTIAVGASVTLTAAAFDPGGLSVPTGLVTWTSDNPAVAAVGSETGVMTGVSAGTTVIHASAVGHTANAVVTVGGASTGARAPIVSTNDADHVSTTSAGIGGTVDPHGLATKVWFEWGTSSTALSATGISDSSSQTLTWGLTVNTAPATTYFFRIAAQNSDGISRGVIKSFTTCATTGCTPSGPPAGYARFTGTIRDVNNVPVPVATVSLPYGQNKAYSTTTDAAGNYVLDARASDFAGVSPVALVVFKDRYLPRTYLYTTMTAGGQYTLSTTPATATRQLAANEFVPQGAQSLWHIGDDDFSGSANSQLQTANSGSQLSFPVVTWDAQMRGLYQTATVTLIARGIETTSCPGNRFTLSSEAGGSAVSATPNNSDAGGGFSSYQFTVTLPQFADGRVLFVATAGACPANGGLDDWEFSQVLITFGR